MTDTDQTGVAARCMNAAAALEPALRAAGVPCDPEGTYAFTRGAAGAEEVIVTVPDAMDMPAGEWNLLVETAVGAHYAAAGARPPAAVKARQSAVSRLLTPY